MKKIYLIGKVAAAEIDDFAPEFMTASQMLEKKGFEVLNPLMIHIKTTYTPASLRWQEGCLKCLEAIKEAEAVYVLPSAEHCEIAQFELQSALRQNKDVYYELENVEANELIDNIHN